MNLSLQSLNFIFRAAAGAWPRGIHLKTLMHGSGCLRQTFSGFMHPGGMEVFNRDLKMLKATFHFRPIAFHFTRRPIIIVLRCAGQTGLFSLEFLYLASDFHGLL